MCIILWLKTACHPISLNGTININQKNKHRRIRQV
jgi:hypothetical protein